MTTRAVAVGSLTIGGGGPLVLIGGPCAIENERHALMTAERLATIAADCRVPFIYKSSYDKANRSAVNSYRGPGLVEGLRILRRVRDTLRVPVLSDVHQVSEVDPAAEVLDVIQIPAFLCRQTDLILAAAATGKPVNVKKGQFVAPRDMKNVVDKILSKGNEAILLTERGTSFGYNNLVVDMRGLAIMRAFGYPIVFDATHSVQLPGGAGDRSGGEREYVPALARAAVAFGVDALFMEMHEDPDRTLPDGRSLSDGPNMLRIEAEAILGLIPRLDERFERAVELLRGCSGRVIVTGMGKSGLIGRKIAATLASTGTPAHFLHPAEGVHGDLGMVARGDVVLALSNSGETDEVLAILPPLKRLGVPIVLLTGNPTSSLARQCEVVLDVSVPEEACPMNLAPTSSTTAALAVGDALALALLELRGLRPEDYAALHPRGSLGWRALFRVSDLMLTGDAVPVVPESTPLREVIVEMTQKRKGMTTVIDGAGRLAGVITDGDLRRLHLTGRSIDDLSAGQMASAEPKTIRAEDLASKALEVMETWQITSLVIVDEARRPVGLIHLHDILRAKIV